MSKSDIAALLIWATQILIYLVIRGLRAP